MSDARTLLVQNIECDFAFGRRLEEVIENGAVGRILRGGSTGLKRRVGVVVPTSANGRSGREEADRGVGEVGCELSER